MQGAALTDTALPGPGLTLVVGPNGSFAEGLELLLTGDTYRWSQRSKVWYDGWGAWRRNDTPCSAELRSARCAVRRTCAGSGG